MNLKRNELKKIIYEFNSISNRLLQAEFHDYLGILKKFVSYINESPIIHDYITNCGPCDQDLEQEFSELRKAYGQAIFDLGDSTEEEVRNVYAILNHIVNNDIEIIHYVARGYTSSNKYQDMTKAFSNRVVMVLIRHIESYLTKVGIDMGLNENVTYTITGNGQVNIASDNATINVTQSLGVDIAQLTNLINDIKANATCLSKEDQETLSDGLEAIESEVQSKRPKTNVLRMALKGLNMLKGSVEFGAAVATLIQYFQTAGIL